MSAIAITGMACRYAEARSPRQLWENVLAQRQSFRRIPAVRLRVEDYSSDQNDESISVQMAAVLDDYEFDRVRFHVSRETFLSTDMVHWLALDTAAQALEDARLLEASSAQRERVGVYIGNSLTGEFSRANLLRLRWPYVRRVLASTLNESSSGCSRAQIETLLEEVEARYKAPFPATTEDSLAGGLANTIAGRICNYFDFKGGGYTVDGACASSLLAVTTACAALESGDVDIALAGGVDLSLDPFELAGFSKLGALAPDKMRVFDERSAGFLPGEGCGMVVLMRHEDAVAGQHPPYAVIRGWGVSSDGRGGITRPEASGQKLALKRAYERANYGMDSVAYFEGHGTGTSVGDAAELQALSMARREANTQAAPAGLGSVKANIGHTKAAAGVAGLIKATMAVQTRILPPTTGCDSPHAELAGAKPMLRVLKEGELWPHGECARAGVSAMGFGGINTHVTLEAADRFHRRNFTGAERQQLSSAQDCEVFFFQAASAAALAEQLNQALIHTSYISCAEMTDLAASLATQVTEAGGIRAACVAATPGQLQQNIQQLHEWCTTGVQQQMDSTRGIFLGSGSASPRIGFLFPGQGSPVYTSGGMWARRFSPVCELYAGLSLTQSPAAQTTATETAQPCVVAASLAGLMMLEGCGVKASIALGHSLGELTALSWAGACASQDLLRLVAERGRVMAQKAAASGAMASIRADAHEVKRRLNGDRLVIAAYNSPRQTVVSGEAQALDRFLARLSSSGIHSTRLPVSHAFHSPLVEDVAAAFSGYLAGESFAGLQQRVVSTVTGAVLENDADLRELLAAQITSPVRFADAVALASAETDLFLEVGPGTVLSGIAAEVSDKPAISLNAGSESLRGLLMAVGAAFALGSNVRPSALFEGRFYRSFQPQHTFLANPCESAMVSESPRRSRALPSATRMDTAAIETAGSAIETLRHLVARRTELPLTTIQPENRFLDDLHLNSITVSQMILEAAAQLGVSAPVMPNEYANASLSETAASLETLRQSAPAPTREKHPQGLEPWIRLLETHLVEQSLRPVPHRSVSIGSESQWELFSMRDSAVRDTLAQELKNMPGHGLLCLVPAERDEESAAFLLEVAQMAVKRHVEQAIFVQHGAGGAAALARTLYLENPEMKVRVIRTPPEQSSVGSWVIAEAHSQSPFAEAHYDAARIRREPRVKAIWSGERQEPIALNNSDLLLVTGGGKGIAAECALELARESGCTLALLGRSDAERDPELKQNLLRLAQLGIRFRYDAADIADKGALDTVIRRIEQELGCITAVLHGAGINHPQRLPEITRADLHDTLSPKLTGLENLLRQINAEQLRLLITFGSIIGRAGLQGEGHYALANEWLGRLVEEWQASHPQCRCLNLEWSVWAGAGMGQKLGVLDALMRQGITPLPLDGAIATLKDMLAWKQSPVSTIITGRFGQLPTLQFEHSELPLRRFLEHVQVYYPGIELVADAELSADTDPYVAEHAFQGEQLFPAVCGIEAMAQAAMALRQTDQTPQLRNLRFEQPIVVPRNKTVKIRIAALQRGPETVSVAVRCSSTAYQTDHFSAECFFNDAGEKLSIPDAENPAGCGPEAALNIARDIYDDLLFHRGRFRRIERYRTLQATRSVAEISVPWRAAWFARHLPQDLVMGDAASRDAAIHSIQACIPYKTVLPVGVERITASAGWTHAAATIEAVERLRDGDNFKYDVEIRDAQGKVCESWKGLHLRAVNPIARTTPWPPALLAAYLERKLNELLSVPAMVMLGIGEEDTRDKRNAPIIAKMFGANATLIHRSDGKPEIAGAPTGRENSTTHVSLSHCGPLTLLASSSHALGCDTEQIASRDFSTWEKLLGSEGIALAQQAAEKYALPLDRAATQVWTLKESLRKAGAGFETSLRVDGSAGPWMLWRSGPWAAASFHGEVEGFDSELAFGFVVATKS